MLQKEHISSIKQPDSMTRGRGFNKELKQFFEGINLGNLLGRNAKTLELGSGNSSASNYLSFKYGADTYCVDMGDYHDVPPDRCNKPSLAARVMSFLGSLTDPSRLIIGNIEELPFRDNYF